MNAEVRLELDSLITHLLEESIQPPQQARLEDLLRSDWECRRHYLQTVDAHAYLLQSPAVAAGKILPLSQRPQQSASTRRPWRTSPWSAALVAAALVAVAFGLVAHLRNKPNDIAKNGAVTPVVLPTAVAALEQTEEGCAILAQVYGNTGLASGTMLKPGKLTLPGGLARIEFFSGATLLLEGPAELDLQGPWEAVCVDGKARVRVPPAAQGFKLLAPGMKVVDLGTEFGLSVDRGHGAAEVHVFEGAVEAHPDADPMLLLKEGTSFRLANGKSEHGAAQPTAFMSIAQMDQLAADRAQARFNAWSEWSAHARTDPRLVAYYIFRHHEDNRWERVVNNVVATGVDLREKKGMGAAVGARWTQGRWPMKDALEFKGPGDRVRVPLGDQKYDAITLACWVRVDGLDRRYNALLLTDGYEAGEPHWQIDDVGRLMFSIAYPVTNEPEAVKKSNQIYLSPSIFNLGNQRKWHHIAVTYDNGSGYAIQYLDGKEISREISSFHQPGRPITFGPSEIGNWGLPTPGHKFPIRNLNGRIDEFLIYHSALSGGEIAELYEAGKPD